MGGVWNRLREIDTWVVIVFISTVACVGCMIWAAILERLLNESRVLVHLTSRASATFIKRERLIRARFGIFAVPQRILHWPAALRMAITHVPAGRTHIGILIPKCLSNQFIRIFPCGPWTLIKFISLNYFAPYRILGFRPPPPTLREPTHVPCLFWLYLPDASVWLVWLTFWWVRGRLV